jgi:hypothetical protein
MPTKKEWLFVGELSSNEELKCYLDSNILTATRSNNKYNCTLCEDDHDMRYHKEFINVAKVNHSIKEKGSFLLKNRIKYLKEEETNLFKYVNEKRFVYNIILDPECNCPDCTNCSCFSFLDKAVCKHLALVCLFKKHNFPGLNFSNKFSVRRAQRGRLTKASLALNISD